LILITNAHFVRSHLITESDIEIDRFFGKSILNK